MYAEIYSKAQHRESPGKRTWVNSDELELRFDQSAPDHLGSPAWHFVLKAEMTVITSSGAHSFFDETYKAVERELEVHITPSDLQAIIDLALEIGLISKIQVEDA